MKKKIHPTTNALEVKCLSCGAVHKIYTTAKDLKMDTCNKCHSAFTGKDTGNADRSGRIDKFNRRFKINKK